MVDNKIKKGLGRGLSSLIGETKKEPSINKLPISDDNPLPNPFLIFEFTRQHSLSYSLG